MAKENQTYLDLLKEIRTILGNEKELFVQALGDKAEEVVAEAEYIIEQITGKVIIKIPVTDEGIKTTKILKEKDRYINDNGLYIFSSLYCG
ncbi:transaldolase family protein [Thermaerobacillus caldiproteolyticus]|uniref:transaldolase family protein n=1 Tax=Thermaerobacillus caldiproteolyticus TaxID=247480 RepID=UPI0022643C6A|nr:transaldolase family protein [Anoxybacillus caldiproteolyticus]